MAELEEVVQDFGNNVVSAVKKKPFVIAAVGVGCLGLYVAWKKSQETATDSTAYEAIGYGGYHTVMGGGEAAADSAYYEQVLSENAAYYDSLIGELDSSYSTQLNEVSGQLSKLESRATEAEETNALYRSKIEYDSVISQMKANSELYNVLSGSENAATRKALHAENVALAESIGLTFDDSTGNYRTSDGSIAYTTAKQQAAYTSGTSSKPNTTTSPTAPSGSFQNNKTYNDSVTASVLKATQASSKGYDASIDYSIAIANAKASGADTKTINALQTARQAKIDDMYGGVDPSKK